MEDISWILCWTACPWCEALVPGLGYAITLCFITKLLPTKTQIIATVLFCDTIDRILKSVLDLLSPNACVDDVACFWEWAECLGFAFKCFEAEVVLPLCFLRPLFSRWTNPQLRSFEWGNWTVNLTLIKANLRSGRCVLDGLWLNALQSTAVKASVTDLLWRK